MSDDEEMFLIDEACAIVQIENPHLDPDVQWDEIREMAIAMVVSEHELILAKSKTLLPHARWH